jgi:hypothetical protein
MVRVEDNQDRGIDARSRMPVVWVNPSRTIPKQCMPASSHASPGISTPEALIQVTSFTSSSSL